MLKQLLKPAILSAFMSPVCVSADARLDYQDGERIDTLEVKGNLLKATSRRDPAYAMFYNVTNNSITMVDHAKKTYMVMTEATMKTMGSMASSMQSQIAQQLEAQMVGMSPEERAQMEQMMGALMPKSGQSETPPPIKIVETGQTDEVNGWKCEQFEVYQGTQKLSNTCMSKIKELGVSSEDYAVIRGFVDFAHSMAETLSSIRDEGFFDLALEADRIPVRIQQGVNGNMKLKSASSETINADDFGIPENYQEQSVMDMMR